MKAKPMSAILLVACLGLTGCGHTAGARALSGGAIGAGAGAVLGTVTGIGPGAGAAIGGGVGAVAGATISSKTLNLGKPLVGE